MRKQSTWAMYMLSVASILLAMQCFTVAFAEESAVARWDVVSKNQQIVASVYPREGDVKMGLFQEWVLQLKDRDGKPIYPARISIGGGMPAHGHGLPTQPQVTKYLDQGKFLIEGMKFNMPGDWVLAFGVDSQQATDTLRFELAVSH